MKHDTYTPSLFDTRPIAPSPVQNEPVSARKQVRDKAFNRQREQFKAEYKRFADEYADTHSRFLAADVNAAYAASGKIKPLTDYRCVGGVFARMVEKGELQVVDTRKAADGSGRTMPVYSRPEVSNA